MKSMASTFSSGYYWLAVSLCLVTLSSRGRAQNYNDGPSRSLYISHGPNKGGWRPIVTSSSAGASGHVSYNFGNVLNSQPQATQKIMTGSSILENKNLLPHLISSEYYGNGILSTSIRPLVTRDTNKLSTLGSYKTSHYPQNSIHLNAPINSYLNPFSLPGNSGLNPYKLAPGFQFDNNIFLRHPQQVSHRPLYNKPQGQMMLGKRLKHNQVQAQILQQLAVNQYHQTFQNYQNSIKKPIESYSRPLEGYVRPAENYSKPNANVQKPVDPHDSLLKQTKSKIQSVAPVTYKPPLGSHFQQYGLQEESFGPIPSSILGSFSSFGHASVKARDPNYSGGKNGYLSTTSTKAPYITTEAHVESSTADVEIKVPSEEAAISASSSANYNSNNGNVKDDYSKNLVPPPQIQTHFENYQINKYSAKNSTFNEIKPYVSPSIRDSFIPSPPDPLNKYQSSLDASRFPIVKLNQPQNYVYNTNIPTKRPGATSFFDSTLSPSATTDPFEPQSTDIVPDNLLVQVPPPYTSFNAFNGHSVKVENNNHKDKYQAFSAINHNSAPSKYKVYEDVQYFPPRGHEYFDTKYTKPKYQTNLDNANQDHSYEVTETWGPSGESITQPTLHSWLNPSQSFHQFSNILGPPKNPYKVSLTKHENKIVSQPYYPTSVPSNAPEVSPPSDVTTIYSTISENKKNINNLSQLENALSTRDVLSESKKPLETIFNLPSPASDIVQEEPKVTTPETQAQEEVTTHYSNYNIRRKPNRYRTHSETSTPSTTSTVDEDLTTRYETYKEHAQETENDLQINDLPTIPPGKYYKRPVSTTLPTSDIWNEDKIKKRNKNRRRRPTKASTTTTENHSEETIITTEQPVRTYRYRTTTPPPEVEDVTKPLRPKVRFAHKSRPTRPSVLKSESTSSAQPTMLPTVPVTIRPKLHSRIRTTTSTSLDFEDISETTTVRGTKILDTIEQSSIMKIAKDHHFHRSPSTKYSPTGIGIFNESPDYSHKQDEKDTPTSDISIHTSEHKFSAQKLRDSSLTEESQNIQIDHQDSSHQDSNTEIQITPTLPTILEEKLATTYIQASQSTRVEQVFTEQKSGNRGSAKSEDNSVIKNETTGNEEALPSTSESEVVSTTPVSSTTKSNRNKSKSSKYDTNRPRFSVKDYRNRLNQYTSSTSTDKPFSTETSPRLRFPNRSRYPSFKDPYGDSKAAGSELSTSTEQPRKKFMPKDPRHKNGYDPLNEESVDNNVVANLKVPPAQKINATVEEEAIPKPSNRLRGSLRRDHNRQRTTTSTETPANENVNEKQPQKLNNVYTNLKRPNIPVLRKRVHHKNKTAEIAEPNVTDATVISTSQNFLLNLEDDNQTSTEKSTSETAIMKIAKDDRKHPPVEDIADNFTIDPSQRVADLTLAASKEYNTPGLFKSVSPNTRRVPNYFTIATDDPILPIEAFFPQLNPKKDS